MNTSRLSLHNGRMGAALAVRVIPRASQNKIAQILGDGTLKIRLNAPPAEGKANQALVNFLADILDVNPSQVEIIAGEHSRNKLVTILDLDAETVNQRIRQEIKRR